MVIGVANELQISNEDMHTLASSSPLKREEERKNDESPHLF